MSVNLSNTAPMAMPMRSSVGLTPRDRLELMTPSLPAATLKRQMGSNNADQASLRLIGGRMMRGFTLVVFLTVVQIIASVGCASTANNTTLGSDVQQKADSEILVEDLIGQVQEALRFVQDTAAAGQLPKLASVRLRLSTQFASSGKGKLNLYVISLGGGIQQENAQTLTLTLEPPEPRLGIEPTFATGLSEGLAAGILAASRAAGSAKSQKPELGLAELSASIKFIVKKEAAGGVNFQILPVTAELGTQISQTESHQITVLFKDTQ